MRFAHTFYHAASLNDADTVIGEGGIIKLSMVGVPSHIVIYGDDRLTRQVTLSLRDREAPPYTRIISLARNICIGGSRSSQ